MHNINNYDPELARKILLPLYKSTYEFELNYKDTINSRLSFLLTLETLIIGGLIYFINGNIEFTYDIANVIFFILLVLASLSVIANIVFFGFTIFGYRYAYLIPLGKIDNIVIKIKKENDKTSSQIEKRDIEKELNTFLLTQYRKSADINHNSNIRKSGFFRITLISQFITVVFLALALISFFYIMCQTLNQTKEIQPKSLIAQTNEKVNTITNQTPLKR